MGIYDRTLLAKDECDVLLLFDTTLSMQDEINKVKAIFEPLAEEIMGLMPEVNFSWAVAEYQAANQFKSGINVKLKFTDNHTEFVLQYQNYVPLVALRTANAFASTSCTGVELIVRGKSEIHCQPDCNLGRR